MNEEKNIIVVDPSSFLFVNFSDEVLKNSSEEERGSEWFTVLNELDGKIHSQGKTDSVNFSDDRLVQIAYQIMCKTEVFTNSASLMQWWIVKRYFDLYLPESLELKEQLRNIATLFIGLNFTGAQISEEQKIESKKQIDEIEKQIFEEDYPQQFPQFFLDLIESGAMPVNEFLGNEKKQYEGLKTIAELMLSEKDELSFEEIKLWEQALKEANEFLNA